MAAKQPRALTEEVSPGNTARISAAGMAVAITAVILVVMAGLMLGPMRQETAAVDETTYIGGGYAYFQTGSAKMAEEQPLLLQMLLAAPMLSMDVHISETARNLMEMRAFSPLAFPWNGGPARPLLEVFPQGVTWYHFGLPESQYFGQILVYDQHNDAEKIMFRARLIALAFTVVTGAFLFFWARQLTGNPWAGVMAAALWAFNPIALAYGHLAITEPGISLLFPVAVWWFIRTVQAPSLRNVFLLGAAMAVALELKIVALLLWPLFVALLLMWWLRVRGTTDSPRLFSLPLKGFLQRFAFVFAGFWVAVLVIYFPHWSPPPPVDPQQARALGVPDWFVALRPLLIPGNFFKSVTLKTLHSQVGAISYLIGEWSTKGWWYYYPVAMWFKTPIPLLAVSVAGGLLMLRRIQKTPIVALIPWLAAALFLLISMTNKLSTGVRHVIPVYPLLAVGVADQLARADRKWRVLGWLLCGWLALVAFLAYPNFIPYFNEFAGGPEKGYKYLIDSNYDWGQDGRRLKNWMAQNGVNHIYLDYFGTQASIEWLKIPNQRVGVEQARQIQQGYLVVSASELMHPEWEWLRASRSPVARVAYTLFVYQFP
jgi:hypothetical protein